jgi:hypothetical protein
VKKTKIGLSFYMLKVAVPDERKKKLNYFKMNNINSLDISNIIYDFLHNKSVDFENDISNHKLYRTKNIEIIKHYIKDKYLFSSINSIVESGDYGMEHTIVDSKTNTVVYNQKRYQAAILPFGFSVYYSEGIETALLVTQTFGGKSLSNRIKDILTEAIKKVDSNYCVDIKSVAPKEYFIRLMNNEQIKNMYIETYKQPKSTDISDLMNNNTFIDYSVREIKYKAPILKNKNIFNKIFLDRSLKETKEIKGLTSDEEEITNLRLEFNINGRPKVVNYNTFINLKTTEDVTKYIDINKETGHPNRGSLFKGMRNYSLQYLQILGIIINLEGDEEIQDIWIKSYYIKNKNGKEEVIERINDKYFSYSC